jgi:hypothetical protein
VPRILGPPPYVGVASFLLIVLGRGGPSLAGYGVGSMSLFAFLLTIQVLHGKSESKDDFVKKGAVRTAIATSFTVSYLMLLAIGLDSGLGLNLNNGPSSKLPSSLHIHHRNILRHSKLGKNRRPSEGQIVSLRLTLPVSTIDLLLSQTNILAHSIVADSS